MTDMITLNETSIASYVDTADASSPLLLTDDEVAAVSGGYTERELPYIEAGGGVLMMGAGAYIAYAGGASYIAAAAATGFAVAGAPLVIGIFAGALLIGGGILVWDGVRSTVAN
jgi:hypothetical protein